MGFSLTTAFEEPKVPSAFACLVGKSEGPKVTGGPSCLVILSTKYWDEDSKLYYYGYRYYVPGVGRWVSRDYIAEKGSVNIYSFSDNTPINNIDPKGLMSISAEIKTWHGSVEWHKGNNSGGYLNTDNPIFGRKGAGQYNETHAVIDGGIKGTVTAWMNSSTTKKGYWRNPDSFQMSTDLFGVMKICDCCNVRVSWKLSARISSSAPLGGSHSTNARFDNDEVIASDNGIVDTEKENSKTYVCPEKPLCLELFFDVGSAWEDFDGNGEGVKANASLTASAEEI